jgi:hypothetical protein
MASPSSDFVERNMRGNPMRLASVLFGEYFAIDQRIDQIVCSLVRLASDAPYLVACRLRYHRAFLQTSLLDGRISPKPIAMSRPHRADRDCKNGVLAPAIAHRPPRI